MGDKWKNLWKFEQCRTGIKHRAMQIDDNKPFGYSQQPSSVHTDTFKHRLNFETWRCKYWTRNLLFDCLFACVFMTTIRCADGGIVDTVCDDTPLSAATKPTIRLKVVRVIGKNCVTVNGILSSAHSPLPWILQTKPRRRVHDIYPRRNRAFPQNEKNRASHYFRSKQ